MKIRKIAVAALLFSILLTLVPIVPTRAESTYDLSQVAYYDQVKQSLNLTEQQENMLKEYGFTTIEVESGSDSGLNPQNRFEDFYYTKVYQPDLPVFITTDSILHLFHVVFDCSLKMIENDTFYQMMFDVAQYAFEKSLSDYNSIPHDGSVTYWAVRNSTVYFAVAMSLISGENVVVPSELSADVNFFLDEIYAEEPRFLTAAFWGYPNDVVEVKFDFTQFTVRGHYLGVPRLEQYFRTMMWYGNFPIFIPRSDETYTWFMSHIDAPAIVYTRDIFKQNPTYFDKWITLYNVTGALVGESDSINPLNLEIALKNVFGEQNQYLSEVASSGGLDALSVELSKPEYEQKILGQAMISSAWGQEQVRYPIVYQFMGQRYVPDSFMFQMLCWDKTGYNSEGGRRIMPKSLDVFAVLGSERAYQLLTPDKDYTNYTDNFEVLKDTFDNLTEEQWTQSSYMAWIYTLESLIDVEYNASYPEFMTNLAWEDQKLNTACGSWAQLRHDTLLYAKQAYIPGWLCSYPEAFVEPNPEFYSRMQKLSERTITAVNILPSASVNPIILDCLETVKNATQQLEVISNKELNKEALTTEETDFIKQLVYGCGSGGFVGWYVDTVHEIAMAANYTSLLDVPLIADVATFPPGDQDYPPQILHVAVGYVNGLVVLYPLNNGTLVAAVGPVYSYYEFPLIGTKRLNDDEWKTMLATEDRETYLPEWVKDIYGLQAPLFLPEHLSVTILIAATAVMITAAVALSKKIGITKRYASSENGHLSNQDMALDN